MPSPSHEEYRKSVLSWFRNHGHEPDVAEQLEQHGKAALVLWHLDLEPAREILKRGYANSPRGGDPWDPLALLRCLLLACLVLRPKINSWVKDIKACRVLCVRVLSARVLDLSSRGGLGPAWHKPAAMLPARCIDASDRDAGWAVRTTGRPPVFNCTAPASPRSSWWVSSAGGPLGQGVPVVPGQPVAG